MHLCQLFRRYWCCRNKGPHWELLLWIQDLSGWLDEITILNTEACLAPSLVDSSILAWSNYCLYLLLLFVLFWVAEEVVWVKSWRRKNQEHHRECWTLMGSTCLSWPHPPHAPPPSPGLRHQTLVASFHLALYKTHTYAYLSPILCVIFKVNFEGYGLRIHNVPEKT